MDMEKVAMRARAKQFNTTMKEFINKLLAVHTSDDCGLKTAKKLLKIGGRSNVLAPSEVFYESLSPHMDKVIERDETFFFEHGSCVLPVVKFNQLWQNSSPATRISIWEYVEHMYEIAGMVHGRKSTVANARSSKTSAAAAGGGGGGEGGEGGEGGGIGGGIGVDDSVLSIPDITRMLETLDLSALGVDSGSIGSCSTMSDVLDVVSKVNTVELARVMGGLGLSGFDIDGHGHDDRKNALLDVINKTMGDTKIDDMESVKKVDIARLLGDFMTVLPDELKGKLDIVTEMMKNNNIQTVDDVMTMMSQGSGGVMGVPTGMGGVNGPENNFDMASIMKGLNLDELFTGEDGSVTTLSMLGSMASLASAAGTKTGFENEEQGFGGQEDETSLFSMLSGSFNGGLQQ